VKILMLVSRLNIGGTEKYILSVSRYLISRGNQVGIVSQGGPLEKEFKRSGIVVHLLQGKTFLNHVYCLSMIISKSKYQCINAHDSLSFSLATTLRRKYNIPVIITVHGDYNNHSALLAASKVSESVISVSPLLSKWLIRRNINSRKIHMIPNGINVADYNSLSEKKKWRKGLRLSQVAKVLVYAGRFTSDKYPIAKNVILASEMVAKHNYNFNAFFIGPGSLRSKLQQLASKVNHRLGRRAIIVRSPLTLIQRAYYAADVVVGTGRVALEALACARPVIAVGVKGYCGIVKPQNINKIIQHHFGDHGAFAPITVKKLAADIRSLLKQPDLAKSLGKSGSEIVKKRFSIDKIGALLMQRYNASRL
jgi:glycosyltransferase involved in cell wall biosynthesis